MTEYFFTPGDFDAVNRWGGGALYAAIVNSKY